MFDKALSEGELSAWQSLKLQTSCKTTIVWNMRRKSKSYLKSFYQLGEQMSVKQHFLQLHLDYFPKNCGDLSEE